MPIERLLATHGQLLERIRRLEPGFVPSTAVATRSGPARTFTPDGRDVDLATSPMAPPLARRALGFDENPPSPRIDGEARHTPPASDPFAEREASSIVVGVRAFADDGPPVMGFEERTHGTDPIGAARTSYPDDIEPSRAIIPATPGRFDAVSAASVDPDPIADDFRSELPPGPEVEQKVEPKVDPQTEPGTTVEREVEAGTEVGPQIGAEPEPDTFESRIAPRKASKTPALAVFETAPSGTPCTIIDMSATGARLRFPPRGSGYTDPSNIPSRFWLQIKLDRMQVECEVVRLTGEDMGVRFVSVPQPLSRAKPAPRKVDATRASAVRASVTKRR